MKKKIQVKHTHRYTNMQSILFEGYANCNDFDEYLELSYEEEDKTKVVMYCFAKYIVIERYGEVLSKLELHKNKKTSNPMNSIYGTFEIEVSTYDYQKDDHYIMVEYDVENGSEEKDGFKIEIIIEEDHHEYN